MGRLLITIGILFVVIGLFLWSLAPISSHWGICRGHFDYGKAWQFLFSCCQLYCC